MGNRHLTGPPTTPPGPTTAINKGEKLLEKTTTQPESSQTLDKADLSRAYKPPKFDLFNWDLVHGEGYTTENKDETIVFYQQVLATDFLLANLSPPGTGKTYNVMGLLNQIGRPIKFLTKSPDNPPLAELEEMERAVTRTKYTCQHHETIQKIHEEVDLDGYNSTRFCGDCSLFELCKSSDGGNYRNPERYFDEETQKWVSKNAYVGGNGLGYLHLKKLETQSKESTRMSEKSITKYHLKKDTIVVIDELQQTSLLVQHQIAITVLSARFSELNSQIQLVLFPLLNRFSSLFDDPDLDSRSKAKRYQWGINPELFIREMSECLPPDIDFDKVLDG